LPLLHYQIDAITPLILSAITPLACWPLRHYAIAIDYAISAIIDSHYCH
jgi:hypothetical protein